MTLADARQQIEEMIAEHGENSNHVCIFISRNEIRDDVLDMVDVPEAVTDQHINSAITLLMNTELMYDYKDVIQENLYENYPELFDEE